MENPKRHNAAKEINVKGGIHSGRINLERHSRKERGAEEKEQFKKTISFEMRTHIMQVK